MILQTPQQPRVSYALVNTVSEQPWQNTLGEQQISCQLWPIKRSVWSISEAQAMQPRQSFMRGKIAGSTALMRLVASMNSCKINPAPSQMGSEYSLGCTEQADDPEDIMHSATGATDSYASRLPTRCFSAAKSAVGWDKLTGRTLTKRQSRFHDRPTGR